MAHRLTVPGRGARRFALAFVPLLVVVAVSLPTTGVGPGPLVHLDSPLTTPDQIVWGNYGPGGPFVRANTSATYFPGGGGYVLMFGGNGNGAPGDCSAYCNDSWYISGEAYNVYNLTPSTPTPSQRAHAGLAYDEELGDAVLFGGENRTTVFNDTWLYVGHGAWQKEELRVAPSPRSDMVMVSDPSDGGVLLFGGEGSGGQALDDTWLFNATGWHELSPKAAPSARWGAAATLGGSPRHVLLFGGTNGTTFYNDSWTFENDSWAPINLGPAPPARADADLVMTGAGYPVLFGGQTATQYLNDTWTSTGGNWFNISYLNQGGPPPTSGAVMVNDASNGPNFFWLLGGRNQTTLDPDLRSVSFPWGGDLGNLTASLRVSPISGREPLTVTVNGTAVGGVPPYQFSWNFGDGSPIVSGPEVTHTYSVPGLQIITLTVTDSNAVTAQATHNVTVLPPVPPPPPRPLLPAWLTTPASEATLVAILFAAMAILAVRWVVAGRRRIRIWDEGLGVTLPQLPEMVVARALTLVRHRDLRAFAKGVHSDLVHWRDSRNEVIAGRPGRWRAIGTWGLRRALVAVPQLVTVLTVVYLLTTVLPGLVEGSLPSAPVLLSNWGSFVVNMFTGQWGSVVVLSSAKASVSVPVTSYVGAFVGPTFEMGFVALLISIAISYPIGLKSGWRRAGWVDDGSRAYSSFGVFFPSVVVCLVSIAATWVFVVNDWGDYASGSTGTLPSSLWFFNTYGAEPVWVAPDGATTPTGIPVLDALIGGDPAAAELIAVKVVIGALVVALVYSAIFLRYARLATADVAEEPHLTASRSRGVPEHDLLWTHTSRRILPVYVYVFGTTFSTFIFVLAIVEVIFQDSGLGHLLIGSSLGPIQTATIFLLSLLIIVVNAGAEVAAQVLDPRWVEGGRG